MVEAGDYTFKTREGAGSAAAPRVAFPAGLLAAARFWNHEEYYRAGGVEQGAGGSESRGRRPGTGATDDRWVEFLLRRREYSDWLYVYLLGTLTMALS